MSLPDQFHRQRGMVAQSKLEGLRVFLSGTNDAVAELIVLLRQLGVGNGEGKIGFHPEGTPIKNVFWKLMFPDTATLDDASLKNDQVFNTVPFGEVNLTQWDIRLDLNGVVSNQHADLYGRVNGPRAFVSTEPIDLFTPVSKGHPLTPSLQTAAAAAMVERLLLQCAVATAVTVSDAWYTLTCRIETTNESEARAFVQGLGGEDLNLQPTSDGLATLARYRLHDPTLPNPFTQVNVALLKKNTEPWSLDLGLLKWHEAQGELDRVWEPRLQEMLILGAGGLGSWSAPLLVEQFREGRIHLIDGDESIELHNLNRQVLYAEEHIGLPKASVAVQRLLDLNSKVEIIGYDEYLLPHHLDVDASPDEDCFDLDDTAIENRLYAPLQQSQIYLACLDNMRARTLLNEAAINFGSVMINGAGESSSGIVERFEGDEGCMVCRYGQDTAYALEVVSCTEEGKRPIASIVTTTAWTGAMMSAYALLETKGLSGKHAGRMEWSQGAVLRKEVVGKPPWIDDACSSHI